jgi:bifunctional enzyme CysN/CysC
LSGAPADEVSTLVARLSGESGKDTFATSQRIFIIAGTSGDEPRAAMSAAAADLSLIVADAGKGLTTETRQQAAIACTVGVPSVLAVNRLDLLGWDRNSHEAVSEAFRGFVAQFDHASAIAIPVSVQRGDNIATPSPNTPWYEGPTLLPYLETVQIDPDGARRPLRLPIDAASRPDPDHRRYEGTIASGTLRRGDKVQVAVSGATSVVDHVLVDGDDSEQAGPGDTVSVTLAGHIDAGTGDVLSIPSIGRRWPSSCGSSRMDG